MSSNIDEIKRLLNLDKEDKFNANLKKLDSLLEDNQFLTELKYQDPIEYTKLIQNGTYEYFEPRQILQVVGGYATSFFVILDGFVDVFIKQKKDENSLFGARQLKKGEYFNDLPLITVQKSLLQYQAGDNGGASVLVVKSKDFAPIETNLHVQMDMSIEYLKTLPFLWNQNQKQILLLHLLAIKERVDNKQPVFLEGDKSNLVYIVLQGEFAVYKHFQDLQTRRNQQISLDNTSSDNNVSTKAFHLHEFNSNKHIKARVLRVLEMFGEEDIIAKRNRSCSVICESPDAILLVLTKSVFKYILMGVEITRNDILCKLKAKDLELARILNKQAVQISSARVHILGQDKLLIKETEDYVKTRGYQNSKRQYGKNGQAHSSLESINRSGLSSFEDDSLIKNLSFKNQFLKQITNDNKFLDDYTNTNLEIPQQENSPAIEKKRLILPPVKGFTNDYASGNSHHFSAKLINNTSTSQLVRQSYQTSIQQSQIGVSNMYFDQPITIKRSISYYAPSNSNQEAFKLLNTDSVNSSALSKLPKDYSDLCLQRTKIFQNIQKGSKRMININQDKIQLPLSLPTEMSQMGSPYQNNSLTLQSSNSRRDFTAFDDLRKNTQQQLQKVQMSKEQTPLGRIKSDITIEQLDQKEKQYSEEIQKYISKYERALTQSAVQDTSPRPSPNKAKVIYKKPLGEDYYIQLQKKKEEQLKSERDATNPSAPKRNFKINYYQSKN